MSAVGVSIPNTVRGEQHTGVEDIRDTAGCLSRKVVENGACISPSLLLRTLPLTIV